jgi:hypothetical protein
MKNIRLNVFETNSSSTHSITISAASRGMYDTLPVEDGEVVLSGGEFGWEWNKYNDALTKANYAMVFSENHPAGRKMLADVIKKQTGAKTVLFKDNNYSYIDHQSGPGEGGEGVKAFESEENLRDFIFSLDSWLFTGNDNEDAPSNFYDVGDVKYTHILDLDGHTVYLKAYPNDKDLRDSLEVLARKHHLTQYSRHYGHNDPPFSIGYGDHKDNDSFAKMKDGFIALFKFKYLYDDDNKFLGQEVTEKIDVPFKITPL